MAVVEDLDDNISNTTAVLENVSTQSPWNKSSDDIHYWDLPTTIALGVILSVVMVLAIFGNLMVIIVVIRHRGMRTRTNMFLVNLAVADFLVGCLAVPFSLTTLIKGHWIFGQAMCTINGFLNCMCLVVSIHTLMYISIHKYFSIARPFSRIFNVQKILIMIGLAWCWAIFCSIITVTGLTHVYDKPGAMQCGPEYPNYSDTKSTIHHLIIQISDIFIPFIIFIFSYTKMFLEIRRHTTRLRKNSTLEIDAVLSQQKRVTVTMFIVLAVFIICWLPYHVYAMYTTSLQDKSKVPSIINPAAYTFAYVNSACNPIIYAFRSPSFREGYKEILCQTPQYVVSDGPFGYNITRTVRRSTASEVVVNITNGKARMIRALSREANPPRHQFMNIDNTEWLKHSAVPQTPEGLPSPKLLQEKREMQDLCSDQLPPTESRLICQKTWRSGPSNLRPYLEDTPWGSLEVKQNLLTDTLMPEDSPSPWRRLSNMFGSMKGSFKSANRTPSDRSLPTMTSRSRSSSFGSVHVVTPSSKEKSLSGVMRKMRKTSHGNSIIKRDDSVIVMKDGKIVCIRENKNPKKVYSSGEINSRKESSFSEPRVNNSFSMDFFELKSPKRAPDGKALPKSSLMMQNGRTKSLDRIIDISSVEEEIAENSHSSESCFNSKNELALTSGSSSFNSFKNIPNGGVRTDRTNEFSNQSNNSSRLDCDEQKLGDDSEGLHNGIESLAQINPGMDDADLYVHSEMSTPALMVTVDDDLMNLELQDDCFSPKRCKSEPFLFDDPPEVIVKSKSTDVVSRMLRRYPSVEHLDLPSPNFKRSASDTKIGKSVPKALSFMTNCNAKQDKESPL